MHADLEMGSPIEDYAVYLLRSCKTIHLVRHGEGYHNVAGEVDHSAYLSFDYFDASLTPLGWEQADRLNKHLAKTGISEKIELVVTSPLMRAMQTAVGIVGRKKYAGGNESQPPLMVENSGNSKHSAISSSGCPPFVAMEYCREHLGVHPCDKRRSISTYRDQFPAIKFSEIETDEDTWWTPDERETDDHIYSRAKTFLAWLLKRKERQIMVVSHSSFLCHLLSLFGHSCSTSIQNEMHKGLKNCEMRTIVVTEQRALGEPIPEDYCGGIPQTLNEAIANELKENGGSS